MGLTVHAVSGNSMYPSINDGDYVVAFGWRFTRYRLGDIVVVRHPAYGTIIKRVSEIDEQGTVCLAGDNPASTPVEKLGRQPKSAIIGKVVWHLRSREEQPARNLDL